MAKKYLTSNQILEKVPHIKYWHLEYLVRSKKINVKCFGKGKPRLFKNSDIDIIIKWLEKSNEN